MKNHIYLLVLPVLTLGAVSTALAQESCDGALVRATYNLSNNVGLDWRLADLVDQATYDQVKHDAGANAVIYGVPVGANYSDYKNHVDTLKKQHNEQLTYTQQLNVAWSGLDPNSVNTYRDCLNAKILNSNGLRGAVIGATKSDISVLFRWNVPGNPKTSVNWSGVPSQLKSLFPKSISQGDVTIVVPRPQQEMSIAANAPGYTTQAIVLEPLPPPAPDLTPKWLHFAFPDIVAPDGNGYAVGHVSGISVSLLDDPSKGTTKVPYKFSYDYYNGSGTWRGSQTIFVKILGANNEVLDTLAFGLDRGHCVYGKAEPRPQPDGFTKDIDASSVKGITVQTNAVSGVQTRC